jgi:2-polyprenyl-3-methyl-5-hydroxy-6-metoxy-1,4-benzoquinol methylase
MNVTNPYETARQVADSVTQDVQDKNRQWWESLPMTYVGWDEAERTLSTNEQMEALRDVFLNGNPWLRDEFDFGCCRNKSVLEIGCGTGVASCLLATAGAKVTAIDITTKAVEMARSCAQHFKVSADIRRMDAEHLDFPAETFDFVFSWGVIHHSAQTEKIAREICRVLRPGGAGLLMVYNRASLRYYVRGWQWLLLRRKLFQGYSLSRVQRFFTDGYYHRHFTPREFRSLLASAKLRATGTWITHMGKQLVPGAPKGLDEALKKRWGWLLVTRFRK